MRRKTMANQQFTTGLSSLPPIEICVTEVTLRRCREYVKQRPIDAHKGTMGHALLVAGSPGMAGAAVLASRACMRSGVGKCTVCTPRSNNDILQISVPEVIVAGYDDLLNPAENRRAQWLDNPAENCRAQWRGENAEAKGWMLDFGAYDGVGIGPGLGQSEASEHMVRMVLGNVKGPAVVDADAINLIGKGVVPIDKLPKGMIFTPHKKEFERLLGAVQKEVPYQLPSGDDSCMQGNAKGVSQLEAGSPCVELGTFDALESKEPQGTAALPMDDVRRAMAFAMDVKGYVLLKGHRSALCCHDGEVIYNTTGNAGMATAGSGDVLTGIITGLLARGYEPKVAAMMGMYLHGLAGDLAAEEVGQESLIASDIIKFLPKATGKVYNY